VLSILIPVYNFEIVELVADLHGLALDTGVLFEILCFDDGSDLAFKKKNRQVKELARVIYEELPENLGRSKIRNELGKAAKYDYLLFMDCDSKVVSDDFIRKYVENLEPETLVYGGRVYDSKAPEDPALRFHWHYGREREQVDYKIRQEQPYHAFQTNNFLIPRKIFLEILFEERLRQYGHEDTLFGFELKNRKVTILHIDNPLQHLGLESVDVFLDKTRKGIENLLQLNAVYPFIETKLLKAYRICRRSGLAYPVRWGYWLFSGLVKRKLRSGKGDLRWFDFFKLGVMLEGSSLWSESDSSSLRSENDGSFPSVGK